ncbi:MAG: DUF4163 domain-containing protein [Clostridia bacterium]|jgi:inhibitor of cysteine peptidase|nr:DUF4163 domain-containing protein [Clostridia bacterium]
MLKKRLKGFLVTATAALLLLSVSTSAGAASDKPAIELNGTKITVAASIQQGKVYLPLRAVTEGLGYTVQWAENDTVTLTKAEDTIIIDLFTNILSVNNHSFYFSGDYLGSSAAGWLRLGERIYLREDFFAENLDLNVVYNGQKVVLQDNKEKAVTIQTVKEAAEKDGLILTLQYPQLTGLADAAVQDALNALFAEAAAQAKAEGEKNAAELAQLKAEGSPTSPNKCETYFDYRLKYNQDNLLSVVLLNYQYAGGAHGSTVQSSYTFDLKTGRALALKDLFKEGADYTALISGLIREEIDRRTAADLLMELEQGGFKAIKEEQDYYLSARGPVIYFQQYEYFPYVAGIQEFLIEYAQIKNMLKA